MGGCDFSDISGSDKNGVVLRISAVELLLVFIGEARVSIPFGYKKLL